MDTWVLEMNEGSGWYAESGHTSWSEGMAALQSVHHLRAEYGVGTRLHWAGNCETCNGVSA